MSKLTLNDKEHKFKALEPNKKNEMVQMAYWMALNKLQERSM